MPAGNATSLGALFVELLFEDKAFTTGMKDAQGKLQSFGSSLDGLTKGIASKFEAVLKGATVALAGMAAASSVVGASFEQEITKVAVLAGASVDSLAEAARRMGSTTQFSATEAATAMESLAQAGFKTDEIISGTEAALSLAAASGGELAAATKIVATTMSQFSLTANQAGRISDVFTEALNSSQLGMEDLTVAMSYAGTVGASFGMTLEETTAAVAMFSNLGLEGSKAGTAFRMSMSQAANVSMSAKAALRKYGLTAKDISPELHDFGQILQTVGEAGITTSDAMAIFGTEVGGNVAALAQQAVAADRTAQSFEEIRTALVDSTGTAEKTAKAMTQTVMGAFEEASGAFEEVLLTIYDQYAGPLRALLLQIASFLNEVAHLFRVASGEVSGGFADALGSITSWLDENETRLAATIVAWTVELTKVGQILASLIPYLDEIALLFGTIWVATKVASFVSALSSAYSGVVALQGAVAALAAELGIATGGLYAIAVAVGVVVAGLVTLIAHTNSATVAADRLTAAQTKQAALSDEAFRKEVAAIEDALLAQQQRAQSELSSGRKLSDARRQELNQILSLDAAQAALLVRQGKLVASNGQLRTAASLVEQAFEDADPSGLSDGMDALAKKQRTATEDAIRLAAAMGKSKEEIADLVGVDVSTLDSMGVKVSALRKSFDAGQISAENFGGAIGEMAGQRGVATIEDAQLRLEALVGTIGDARKAQVQLKNDVSLTQRAMIDAAEAQQNRMAGAARATSEFSRAERAEADATAKALEADRQRAADASAKLYRDAADDAATAGKSETERRKIELDQQLRDAAETFDAEIALWEGNAEKITAIEEQKTATLAAIRAKFVAEDAAEARKQTDELVQALDEVADTAKSAIPAMEQMLAAVEEMQPTKLEAAWMRLKGVVGTVGDAFGAVADGVQFIGDAVGEVSGRISGVVSSLTGFSFSVRDLMGEVVSAADKAAENGKGFDAAGYATSFVEGLFEQADRFADLLVTAVPSALEALAEGLPGLMQKVAEAIPIVVQAIVDSIPDVTAALLDNVGPILDALVAGIVSLVEAALDALPDIIRKVLGEILPDLITTLSKAIPEIVTALVDAIPLILQALVDAIPPLLSAVIDAIPRLVMALVDAIPQIVIAVAEAVPQIVGAVLSEIPHLIEMVIGLVPDIILSLAEALPELIPAIVGMIPEVVVEIIAALPRIVFALVKGLTVDLIAKIPKIVWELIKGIMESVGEIGKAIGEAIFGGIGSNPFKKEAEDRRGLGKVFGAIGDLFKRKDKRGAYSGMEYVPATMRMTVHQGERITPAHENTPGRAAPAPAGFAQNFPGGGGAGGATLDLAVLVDGQVVDGAIVTSMGRGRAPKLQRMIRSAIGGTVGFDRGRYTPWSR